MLALLTAFACGGTSPPPATEAPPAAPAATGEVVRPLPAKAPSTARGAAPTRDWRGLAVGTATTDDVQAWLKAKDLDCPGTAAPRRVQFRYGCSVPRALLADRTIAEDARISLMLVRSAWHDPAPPGPPMEPPTGPDQLYFVNLARRYPSTAGVAADYAATVDALTRQYGAPDRAKPITDDKTLEANIARVATEWAFDDLEISVTATHFSRDWAVGESYTDPRLSSTIPDRGGPAVHGGRAPHRNPHEIDGAPATPPENP
jgi:hypothetical protein